MRVKIWIKSIRNQTKEIGQLLKKSPNQIEKRVCMCGWLEFYLVTHKQIVKQRIFFLALVDLPQQNL